MNSKDPANKKNIDNDKKDTDTDNKHETNSESNVSIDADAGKTKTKSEKSEKSENSRSQKSDNEKTKTIDIQIKEAGKWFFKVLSGPNAGAQFYLLNNKTYVIGSDVFSSDITIMDLSVSSQHSKISVSQDGNDVYIEDLNSKNGTVVNGKKISSKTTINNGTYIRLGITSLLLIDSTYQEATILIDKEEKEVYEVQSDDYEKNATRMADYVDAKTKEIEKFSLINFVLRWVDTHGYKLILPTLIGMLGIAILTTSFVFVYKLYNDKAVYDEEIVFPERIIAEIISSYPGVKFIFNKKTSTVLLSGHIVSKSQHKDLIYRVSSVDFILKIIDRIHIDEDIVKEAIDTIRKTPEWKNIRIVIRDPGVFVITGNVLTSVDKQNLVNYVYNTLDIHSFIDEILVEEKIMLEIKKTLDTRNISGITISMDGYAIILDGVIKKSQYKDFNNAMRESESIFGVQRIDNLVVIIDDEPEEEDVLDLSKNYKVSGFLRTKDSGNIVIVYNNKMYKVGDEIDGMTITQIGSSFVLLERKGKQFKVKYST